MAKFAQVGYGHDGRGDGGDRTDGVGYTYVVNDNVRTGDVIQPVATHYKSGKLFATTAKVKSTFKDINTRSNSPLMAETNEIKDKVSEQIDPDNLKQAVKFGDIRENGKQVGRTKEGGGIKPLSTEESQFLQRQANLELAKSQNPSAEISEGSKKYTETYDSYMNRFGDQQ